VVSAALHDKQVTMVKLSQNKKESSLPNLSASHLVSFAGGLAFMALYVNLSGNSSSVGSLLQEEAQMASKVTAAPTSSVRNTGTVSSTRALDRDLLTIGASTHTDKVAGAGALPGCLNDRKSCAKPDMVNPRCRTGQLHFYHTMYNKWLGPYSRDDTEPFQFLEIGFYNGFGFDAFLSFLPRAEAHSLEIACIEEGPREEGKWPWGNFAAKNPRYQEYLDQKKLHCGDASLYEVINNLWTTEMKRPGAPPLKVVVDDASHLAEHMAISLFFWFPKIEPGGLMIIEDIQPIQEADLFRTNVLPQVLKDLHYCGDPNWKDKACFPTIWPLLQSVHCEMHICVFERNDQPAVEYGREESMPPPHALKAEECLLRAHDS
jgi:hypothetical protein